MPWRRPTPFLNPIPSLEWPMNGLIRASLRNPYAVTVLALTVVVLGVLSLFLIPIDILPVFKSPAVQVLTFYGGMPADEHRERHHQPHGAVDRPGQRQRATRNRARSSAPASSAIISRATSTPTAR